MNRCLAERNQLVADHMYLVERIAKYEAKRLPPCFCLEDLQQAGNVGLIDAANKFDPSKGVPFAFYAQRRIKGEMMETARRRRYTDSTHSELEAAVYEREDESCNVVAIDQDIRVRQVRDKVQKALNSLSDDDIKALTTYYYEQRQLAGVGQAFGVRQSRASQILRNARVRMRRAVEAQGITEDLAA